ncbi:MAG: bifunctional riboflavin kinase/FAD synthetase [Clostridia bacterium]|nr:bifunctional riboflavin kinase/FAD synthetase [Clostridia bacterium]
MKKEKYAIALGMFDGVHAGHRALISNAVDLAARKGICSAVFTFSNHPLELINRNISYLTTNEQRERLFLELGADRVDMIPFTEQIRNLSPVEFLHLLGERHQIDTLIAGFNYSFGKAGAGNAELLKKLGQELGFNVEIEEPFFMDGELVSSTRIRELIKKGEVEKAQDLLKRPYAMTGAVVHNRRIGRRIGYPTANLNVKNMVLPADGVYATRTRIDSLTFDSVTNVGCNPTVGGSTRTVETHILNSNADLYGLTMEVGLIKQIRSEKKFSDLDELKIQIASDIETAKKILKTVK